MEKKTGKVWLVGAGPSDPGLFTLKGKAVIKMTIKNLIIKYMNYLESLEGISDTEDYISTMDFEAMCDEIGYNGQAIVKVIDNMYLYCNIAEVKANKDTIINLMIKLAK